jgi:hypothetical protein
MVVFDPSASSFSGQPVSPPPILAVPSKTIQQQHQPHDFWHHRWVQNVLPFATSLIVHLGILAVGIALYHVVTEVRIVPKDQVTIPDSVVIARSKLPAAIVRAKTNDLVLPEARQNLVPDSLLNGTAIELKSRMPDLREPVNDSLTQGIACHGTGGFNGVGNDPGNGQAPFGLPITGGLPRTSLITEKNVGSGRRIVFLCDSSGSMLGVFGSLKQKLKNSITNGLAADSGQEFNIIFFSDDNCFPLFKDGARIATDENKKLAFDFIDNAVSTGGTQPLPAIKFAMAEKPDLLFVLTDGFDQISNFDDVVKAFHDGNKDKKMQINCIFLESDSDPQLEKVLQQIANDGHGKYSKVRKQDM